MINTLDVAPGGTDLVPGGGYVDVVHRDNYLQVDELLIMNCYNYAIIENFLTCV